MATITAITKTWSAAVDPDNPTSTERISASDLNDIFKATINNLVTANNDGGPSTGLEKQSVGWWKIGSDTNHATPGLDGMDLSYQGPGRYGATGGATGRGSFVTNWYTLASGEGASAFGKNTTASGESSFVGGEAYGATAILDASGWASFNFQFASGVQVDAAGNYSAILGGQNNATTSAATHSVVLGGGSVTATQPSMVYLTGTKFKEFTTTEVGNLPDSELGTMVYDTTKSMFVYCTDETPSANVFTPITGSSISGTFTTTDAKTITITNGVVTSIV